MAFDWFNFFVLLGIAHGIICSAVILYREKPMLETKLLVAIIMVLCGLSFKILLHTLGLWDLAALRYFPMAIDLLLQPLLFLYVCSLTTKNFRLDRRQMLHLLPPTLFLVHAIAVYLNVYGFADLQQKDIIAQNWHYNLVKKIEDLLSVLSAFYYGALCLWRINKYRDWLEGATSDSRYPTLQWLRNLLVATLIFGAALGINILLDHSLSGRPWFARWQAMYLYITFLIYYLGMKGFIVINEHHVEQQNIQSTTVEKQGKFEDHVLDDAQAVILDAMENRRLFLDSELTLQKMAIALSLSPALISTTINKRFGKSFRSLVNEYRVTEVKLRLIDLNYSHLSMLGIALECGFNSEASFYRLFKEMTGSSPREFIRSAQG